jgi:hypothetical protein
MVSLLSMGFWRATQIYHRFAEISLPYQLVGNHQKHILTTYLDRWPTETFNEDAKGNLGFEEFQLQNLQGIRRHWYLSFMAYSLLSDQGHPGRSRWAVRGHFQSTGQRCQAVADELLGHLVRWIAQLLLQGKTPDSILHTLLA